ncbi:hypothetical protein AAE478_001561 [Parahypoxylon ruwenzoriense]
MGRRCERCAGLTVELLRSTMILHHPNLRSLRDSAAGGCVLCHLCWTSLRSRYSAEDVGAVLGGAAPPSQGGYRIRDEQVWLTGEFEDDNFPDPDDGRRIRRVSRTNDSSTGSAVWIDCGTPDGQETILPGRGGVLSNDLSVFADPGTPAASHFYERYFTADRNPDGHFEFARWLLQRCQARHPECGLGRGQAAAQPPEMPTRVLDVGTAGDPAVRLVLPRQQGLRAPYLALSYCWGQSARHAIQLRDWNMVALLTSGVEEAALVKTHRDCVRTARQLGIRYIWIDALCIVQGNEADWVYESKRMAQVYGNAVLTLIAGRAAHSDAGFLVNKLEQAAPPCALPIGRKWSGEEEEADKGVSSEDRGEVFLCLPRRVTGEHTVQRGWCYQEKVLSRRTLLYAMDRMCFSCQRLSIWENGSTTLHNSYQLRARLFHSPPDDADASARPEQQLRERERNRLRAQMLRLWYENIFIYYTSRQLTNTHDVFAAISSVAQLAQRSIRSRYLAGLWEADMVRGLLWYTRYSFDRGRFLRMMTKSQLPTGQSVDPRPRRPVTVDGEPAVRAPSWSWASIQGQTAVSRAATYEEQRYLDADNSLVRPMPCPSQNSNSPPRWTAEPDPGCDADVLHMPNCELLFLGRPKRVQILFPLPPSASAATPPRSNPGSAASESPFPGQWPRPCRAPLTQQLRLYWALLQPADLADPILPPDLKAIPSATSGFVSSSPPTAFAVACFDVAEERAADNCWFLPFIRSTGEGLLLRKDEADGKFRRVGIVSAVREQFIPWLVSGPEEEIRLV